MPGWGKPLYEMKEAEIPKGEIPSAFDWRDKGTFLSSLNLQLLEIIYTLVLTRCLQLPFPLNERIRSDSPQLFFRCYYYFVSAVFVVQCISVLSGAGCGCMIESVTILMGNRQLKIKE